MLIAWTTVANLADAERLARGVVEAQLAVCVQIEGPLQSVYSWAGKIEQAVEFRLTLKLLPERVDALREWILAQHPYETPEWLVVRATEVGEKYLSWAQASPTNPPL
jgi:periplasmic divalent cation tolerance protein